MASRMIALALGIACVAWLPMLPSPFAVIGSAMIMLPLRRRFPRISALSLCFLIGIGYGALQGYWLQQRLLSPQLEGLDIDVEGRIVSSPDFSPHRGGTYRFDFKVDAWLVGEDAQLPGLIGANKLRLSYTPTQTPVRPPEQALQSSLQGAELQSLPLPAYGQRWAFTVRLKRPRSFANPGAFDYAAWLVGQGFHATGYVRQASAIGRARDLSGLRAGFVGQIGESLSHYSQSGVLLALAAGERSGLNDQQWELFRVSGTSHLMAISGLHIGIAAGIGWLLGRVLTSLQALHIPLVLPPVLALSFAALYAWLAGFSIPTQRAFIMVCVVVIAVLLSRHIGRWQGWCCAMLLVLLFNPMATLQAGFCLSFAAVAILLAVIEREQRWRSLLRAQWVLLLGLAPFGLMFFQQVSLLAFPVNLLAVPLFSLLIVPLVLLALALEALSGELAAPIWTLANALLEGFMSLLQWLGRYGDAFLFQHYPGLVELLALVLFALIMLLPKAFPARYLAIVCLLPLLTKADYPVPKGEFLVRVLDVGQGLSLIVQTRHHTLVYDVGPRYSESFNMVEAALLPVLRQSKIKALDRLIISHGDSDHAGAYRRLLDEIPVADFIAGADLTGGKPCLAGQKWHWDDVEFAILSPHAGAGSSGNNGSCVLLIQSGEGRALLPGDIESQVERALVETLPENISLLLAPHHGSKTSSSRAFVSKLQPELVVFSAGYKHHYGHPAPEVMNRYRDYGASLAETSRSGMVTVRLGPEGIKNVEHFREQYRFYWNTAGE